MARPKSNSETTQPQEGDEVRYFTAITGLKDAPQHVQPGQTAQDYALGADVSHWDAERLENAVQKGYVTTNAPKASVVPESDAYNEAE